MTDTTTAQGEAGTPDATGADALDAAARRVDTAMERVGLLEPAAQRVARDLKAAIEEFHRDGLVRVVRRLKEDPRGKELLFELVDDPVVHALLLMHGIVRADPVTSAQRALAEVRPYLSSHGGGVELVAVEPPLVRVRLTGTCTGCSQSSATLREVVERALVAGVPGVHQVEVVPNEPEPAVVPLSSIRVRPGVAPPADPDHGWTRGPDLTDLPDERVTLWWPPGVRAGEGANGGPDDESAAVALVRLGDRVAAYANACVHQGLSLARGLVDAQGCVLTCPWHGMKYQALTGESLAAVGQRLTAYPARIDGGAVWLRLTG